MLSKHPGAQLLKTAGDPPVDIRFGNDQYIQCTAVTPVPDPNLPVFSNSDVPLSIRSYYEHWYEDLFYYYPLTYSILLSVASIFSVLHVR